MLFLTLAKESVLFALHALWVNKLRTFLSLLGITIGIFAIISVFTVVDSLEKNLRQSIASLGENVVFIQKWPWEFGPEYQWWKYMNRPVPQISELDEIRKRTKGAEAVAFNVTLRKTVQHSSSSIEGVQVIAVSKDYDKVKSLELAQGRYFSEQESMSGKSICIIGDVIAQVLFPHQSPIGQEIKVMGRKITVIGVFKREGESILGGSVDTQVMLPVNYIRNIADIRSENLDPYILVKAREGVTNEQLIDELTGVMRAIRKLKPLADDDFALNQTSLISNQFDSLFSIVGIAGWAIAGFSILVGGFGIANIMFVSVKERTSLIGIQKSLGAKNYFILLQFLVESVVLSVIGGTIGLVLIFLLTLLIGDGFGMEVSLTRSNIVLGVTLSALIGVISGFIPAYSASQLDPVEAIRANA
jgi:putative ABC transport system permease protein